MTMPIVRTTFQPWREIEVDPSEYEYLKNSGLLVKDAEAAEDEKQAEEKKKTRTRALKPDEKLAADLAAEKAAETK
jgi:hypothetical protein